MANRKTVEFGDFQTPAALAQEVAQFLEMSGELADIIVEPTCGKGSFIRAALDAFPGAMKTYGYDINPSYIGDAEHLLEPERKRRVILECKNFFQMDWPKFFEDKKGSILVIGNPPWVTNATLGSLGSINLPEKTNFQRHRGFAAKTGKANFDISEWMLIRIIEALQQRDACIAVLCKTATARKVLRHVWVNRLSVGKASLHLIDAKKYFQASVDACLLVVHTDIADSVPQAAIYPDLSFNQKISTFGFIGEELVADLNEYMSLRDIDGISYYRWRSGIKHDAAGIMEFTRENGQLINGRGEICDLEDAYLFPLLKSSDIANGRVIPRRSVLVTQRKPSDDTDIIEEEAAKTWSYLMTNKLNLSQRGSSIYLNRPKFSVFGVGDYTFSPWKVAISGLYKNCQFKIVGEHGGKPIVFDDTCYFIPCSSQKEAQFLYELLSSDVCKKFIRSLVFLDAKRPITIDVLNRIDLKRVAERLDREEEACKYLPCGAEFEDRQALFVFEKKEAYRTKKNVRTK